MRKPQVISVQPNRAEKLRYFTIVFVKKYVRDHSGNKNP